jgi:hypothetical protein
MHPKPSQLQQQIGISIRRNYNFILFLGLEIPNFNNIWEFQFKKIVSLFLVSNLQLSTIFLKNTKYVSPNVLISGRTGVKPEKKNLHFFGWRKLLRTSLSFSILDG